MDVADEMTAAIKPLYEQVTSFMYGQDDAAWEALIEYPWNVYSKICMSLNASIKQGGGPLAHWNLTEDFVIGISEEQADDELYDFLVKASVGEKATIELGII